MPSDAQNRDRAALTVGEEVAGRYVIEAEIGRGGMGAVYSARDTRLGRRVALKTLGSESSAHTRQRLESEARAVASIEHPGIVTLFDVVEHAGETVLVMELVAGQTLRETIKARALTADEVANVIHDVSDALAAAHAVNLVHRDVKPDNIMVRTDGRIALLDFGVAKITSDVADPFAPTTTGAGVIVGTPAYLAPEQARAEPIGPATDQFALGVTAYELLTQSLPWPTTTPMLLVASIVSSDPIALTGFDAAVGAVIGRALSKSPADRYPDVRDFASALGTALGVAHPSRPRSLMPVPSAPPSAPRQPSSIEIGKTLRATESARLPTPPPRSRPSRTLVIGSVVVALAVGVGWFAMHRQHAPAVPLPPSDSATPLAVADVPPSETTNPEARAKFHEAMRQLARGGGAAATVAVLDETIKLDPEMASAYLQRAFASYRIAGGLDAPGRRAYRAALDRKDRLGPRDAELLSALGPSFADPPDWQESAKRLEAMTLHRPKDAQVWEALGILRFKQSELDAATAAFARERAVDPNAYTAYFLEGHLLADLGDLEGARKLFAECIERIPTTIECRAGLTTMHRVAGDCAAADRVARETATLAPEQALVYSMRAETAAALGATEESVIDLLSQKRAHMPEARRMHEKSNDDYVLAMRRGDFPAALAALDGLEKGEEEATLEDLGKWTIARATVLWEMGDATKSGAVAIAFLDRMTARVVPEQPFEDPTGNLLAFASAAGALTPAVYRTRRDAWVAGWHARLGEHGWKNDGINLWFGAHASMINPSREQALEALAALPSFGNYDVQHPDASTRASDPEVGAIFLAADKLPEASLRLGEATRWCKLVPYVHAFYSYGETLARQGDTPSACAAFATVQRHWGHAKPRSMTLDAARLAMKKYHCAG